MTVEPIATPASSAASGTSAAQLQDVALQFEELLVRQMTQSLTDTTGLDGSSADAGSSEDDTGTDGATSLLQSFVPDALAQAVRDGGGLGLAPQLVQALGKSRA
jgi:Rod binding domain-containing protein